MVQAQANQNEPRIFFPITDHHAVKYPHLLFDLQLCFCTFFFRLIIFDLDGKSYMGQ